MLYHPHQCMETALALWENTQTLVSTQSRGITNTCTANSLWTVPKPIYREATLVPQFLLGLPESPSLGWGAASPAPLTSAVGISWFKIMGKQIPGADTLNMGPWQYQSQSVHFHHRESRQRWDLPLSYFRAFKKDSRPLQKWLSLQSCSENTPTSADSTKIPKPRFSYHPRTQQH